MKNKCSLRLCLIGSWICLAAAVSFSRAGESVDWETPGGRADENSRSSVPVFYMSCGHSIQKNLNGSNLNLSLTPGGVESPRSASGNKKHFWRALGETSLFIAFFQYRYKKTHTTWIEGVHKYRATWEDQKEKLFDWKNWNYDANCYVLNWQHALAGAVYYNFSRTNNLTLLESLLMSWASSSYWEFVVEYRSDVSINDHIFTPLGGLSVGEAWYQLGKFFADRSDTLSRVLSFLNPLLKLNRMFNRRSFENRKAEPPGWHEFTLDLGVRNIRERNGEAGRSHLYAGLRTQIICLSDYGKTGTAGRIVKQPLFSEIRMDLTGPGGDFEEFNIFTRVVLLGYFKQKLDALNRGYAFYLGLGSAFSVFKKKNGMTNFPCTLKGRNLEALDLENPRDFRDKLSAVHILGPVFDWTRFGGKMKIRWVADWYFDFAMVNAYAFNSYSALFDISGVKTPLLVNGYYYAWGTTLSSEMDISFGGMSVRGSLRCSRYGSIDGKDRFQRLLTDDFHLTDSRTVGKIALAWRIPGAPLMLMASYEGINRRGEIEELLEKSWEWRGLMGVSVNF